LENKMARVVKGPWECLRKRGNNGAVGAEGMPEEDVGKQDGAVRIVSR
jgi:hypothetical protein